MLVSSLTISLDFLLFQMLIWKCQLESDVCHKRRSRWLLNRRFFDIFSFYVKVIQLNFFGSVGSLRKQPTFGGVAKCRLFSGTILSVFLFVSEFKKQNILFPRSFSLPHDGDNNPCTRSRGDQRLMAPSLSFDTKPWSWSNCSREKITQFLE